MIYNQTNIASARQKILPLRKQAEVRNSWLRKRLDVLLPQLMQEADIDCWLVIGREFNEDPLMKTFFVQPEDSSGRLGLLVFLLNREGKVERYSFYKPNGRFADYYQPLWDEAAGSQWQGLNKLLAKKNPRKIGINFSPACSLADGISSTYRQLLRDNLTPEQNAKVVSAELLAIRWLETRLPEELAAYEGIAYLMQSIIKEIFSSSFIHPGITHTSDVEWMFMEQIVGSGVRCNFPTDINVQRKGDPEPRIANTIIQAGDVVRCDAGLEYLGLHTDYQRLAYVMHPGEEEIPAGLRAAFRTGNRFQDIVCANMIEGRTGNEIFFGAKADAEKAGIRNCLYSHPIGYTVHGAGPIIGLMDKQEFIPGAGENKLHDSTCFSLEMNITQFFPEWEQDITMCLEEDLAFVNGKTYFLNGRAEDLYVIR